MVPADIAEVLDDALDRYDESFEDNLKAFGDYSAEDIEAHENKMKAARAWLAENKEN